MDLRFDDPYWYRDRTRVNTLIDGLASTSWFREFDVFAPGHKPGSPFERLDDIRHLIATGDEATAMFAHGEPRMTVDIEDAEAALNLDVHNGRLELRVWLAARPVAQYKGAVLGDLVELLAALRSHWPDCLVATASAFPDPHDSVRYRRTRPLRIANRAINAVVDVLDRDVPSNGPAWVRDTKAMVDAPVPDGVERHEHGRLVAVRWLDDPSDPVAMADACSRHEQWLVQLGVTRRAEGWNDAGDLQVFDVPTLVEVSSDDPATWRKPRGRRPIALVATPRERAVALLEQARAAHFDRVLYRDAGGVLWDPHPPGDWIV